MLYSKNYKSKEELYMQVNKWLKEKWKIIKLQGKRISNKWRKIMKRKWEGNKKEIWISYAKNKQ